ncbi:uncharacterized protein G2W53_018454 [Senna tora]|uniref:Uncharacterized protein n=1 Tax=Senna tora TaxID=362788 RepID=A0A834TVZ2_9FABA|nr:uncharacterized protein G2W53_018454 [Senna tora]
MASKDKSPTIVDEAVVGGSSMMSILGVAEGSVTATLSDTVTEAALGASLGSIAVSDGVGPWYSPKPDVGAVNQLLANDLTTYSSLCILRALGLNLGSSCGGAPYPRRNHQKTGKRVHRRSLYGTKRGRNELGALLGTRGEVYPLHLIEKELTGWVFPEYLSSDHNLKSLAFALASVFGQINQVPIELSDSKARIKTFKDELAEKERALHEEMAARRRDFYPLSNYGMRNRVAQVEHHLGVTVPLEILSKMHSGLERFDDGLRMRREKDGLINCDFNREPPPSHSQGFSSSGSSFCSEGDSSEDSSATLSDGA